MAHVTAPPPEDLPSPRRLRRGAIAVVLGAIALAITVVLPAERGVDITGIGRLIGLTEMGIIKQEILVEMVAESTFLADSRRADSITAADEAAALQAVAQGVTPPRTDTTLVRIQPGEQRSIRLRMQAKAWTVYSWSTDRGVVDDDIRGDSVNAPAGSYYRYHSGTGRPSASGALVARFNGLHGWHWSNTTDSVVSVTLVTRGDYAEIIIGP